MNAEIYQALLDWNPWLSGNFPEQLLGIPRSYHLLTYLEVPEIKIIEGARRVGKSTLLYQMLFTLYKRDKKNLYINFEDEVLRKYSLEEILSAYLEHAEVDYLFVDEIQNCSTWVQLVRKMYDRREMNQIWVSGSNASLIKQDYATLLTGRNLAIHIYPLSFSEFLKFKSVDSNHLTGSKNERILLQKFFNEYMEHGAFPAVANRTVLKKELLISYFEDFIYKDIVARHNVNANKIKELAIYLATNISNFFSYRTISVALNCHLNTVTDYFNYLKEAFLFEELYKFDFSLKKQFSNDKKIYCLDVGLASAISFKFSQDTGRVLENIVFCELRKGPNQLYFHKNTVECDFVIKEELKITQAVQVCVTLEDEKTSKREIAGLLDALQTYNLKSGLILTLSEQGKKEIIVDSKKYTIEIKPVWRWLLERQ